MIQESMRKRRKYIESLDYWQDCVKISKFVCQLYAGDWRPRVDKVFKQLQIQQIVFISIFSCFENLKFLIDGDEISQWDKLLMTWNVCSKITICTFDLFIDHIRIFCNITCDKLSAGNSSDDNTFNFHSIALLYRRFVGGSIYRSFVIWNIGVCQLLLHWKPKNWLVCIIVVLFVEQTFKF